MKISASRRLLVLLTVSGKYAPGSCPRSWGCLGVTNTPLHPASHWPNPGRTHCQVGCWEQVVVYTVLNMEGLKVRIHVQCKRHFLIHFSIAEWHVMSVPGGPYWMTPLGTCVNTQYIVDLPICCAVTVDNTEAELGFKAQKKFHTMRCYLSGQSGLGI